MRIGDRVRTPRGPGTLRAIDHHTLVVFGRQEHEVWLIVELDVGKARIRMRPDIVSPLPPVQSDRATRRRK